MAISLTKKATPVSDTKWANIYANDGHVFVGTCSGLRRISHDPDGANSFHLLAEDPSLGQALKEALAASKTLHPSELAAFFEVQSIEQRYEFWVKQMLAAFDKKNRQHLFSDLRHCTIQSRGDQIEMRPTFHEKLEAWSGDGIDVTDYVIVGANASNLEIARGMIIALSRCA